MVGLCLLKQMGSCKKQHLYLSEPCYCDAAVVRLLQRGGTEWEKLGKAEKLATQLLANSCYGIVLLVSMPLPHFISQLWRKIVFSPRL